MILRHPRHGHSWNKTTLMVPMPCTVCKGLIWPLLSDCSCCLLCGLSSHKACRDKMSQPRCSAEPPRNASTNFDQQRSANATRSNLGALALKQSDSEKHPTAAAELTPGAVVNYYSYDHGVAQVNTFVFNIVDLGGILSTFLTYTKVRYHLKFYFSKTYVTHPV